MPVLRDSGLGRIYITTARHVRAFGVGQAMTGSTRSSEGLDPRRRRILFRAWHRGMREMDLIMGRFADAVIHELSDAELDEFENLMQAPDPEVYRWVAGDVAPTPEYDQPLLRKLRSFYRDERP
jgi:antitoxin CptB